MSMYLVLFPMELRELGGIILIRSSPRIQCIASFFFFFFFFWGGGVIVFVVVVVCFFVFPNEQGKRKKDGLLVSIFAYKRNRETLNPFASRFLSRETGRHRIPVSRFVSEGTGRYRILASR